MKRIQLKLGLASAILCGVGTASAQSPAGAATSENRAPAPSSQPKPASQNETVRSKIVVEFGLLDPLSHRIQFGRNGTTFNYVKDGGQDVLFPTTRLSVEGFWKRRHGLVFLYQPIDIRTEETLRKDLLVDNVRFPAGTAMNFRYGFDFYRISYLYNFLSRRANDELSLGGS